MAAERGRGDEGFKLDCGAVLVIALSLRAESSQFEQFAQTVEAYSQPCLSMEGLQKMSGMTTPCWTGPRAVRATICAGVGTDKDINRQHMFVCLS